MRIRLFLAALLLSSLVGFEVPQPVVIPDGAWGVLQVPAMEISMPLYTGPDQLIIDAENSALVRRWGDGILIADHAGSKHHGAEWRVNDMQVGGACFVISHDETRAYRCTAILLGENTGTAYEYRGRTVTPDKYDVICISCGRGKETFIAYLDFDGIIP